MEHGRKMILVPAEQDLSTQNISNLPFNSPKQNTTKPKKQKENIFSKSAIIERVVTIIVPIALLKAVDNYLRIRNRDGSAVEGSNLKDLLSYALTPGKALVGENEFVELLSRAKVNPDLIINGNLKSKLISYNNNKNQDNIPEINSDNPANEDRPSVIVKVPKRRHEDFASDETENANVNNNKRMKSNSFSSENFRPQPSVIVRAPKRKIMQESENSNIGSEEDESIEPIKRIKPNWDIPY